MNRIRKTRILGFIAGVIALCLSVRAAGAAQTPFEKHYGVGKGSIGIENAGGYYWLLNGDSLEAFRPERTDEGKAALRMTDAYKVAGAPLGFDSDRVNIYAAGEDGVTIISLKHLSNAREYTLAKIGLKEKITKFSNGSRFIVYNSREISGYDAYKAKWEKVLLDNFGKDETIRGVAEGYGLLIVTTNKSVRLVSTTNDHYKNLEMPELAANKEVVVNDFLVTGKMDHLWFAALKMALKVDLKIDAEKKKVEVTGTEKLTPFANPNLSNIMRMTFWKGHLVLFYDDAVYAWNPVTKAWKALIADPEQSKELTPQFIFKGAINTVYKQKDLLLVATSNSGVLSIAFKENDFKIYSLAGTSGLPTANIRDIAPGEPGTYLARAGDGIFVCGLNGGACTALKKPSYVELPVFPETRFVKTVARFGKQLVFLRKGALYRLDPSSGAPKAVVGVYSSETNLPFDVISNGKNLFVIAPETITVLDEEFKVVREIRRSDLLAGAHFDSNISSAAVQGGTLFVGMEKKYELKIDNEPEPAIVIQRRKEHPENFIVPMQNAYMIDLDGFKVKGYGKDAGLNTKNIASAVFHGGTIYAVGQDIPSGKKQILFLNEKTDAWELFAAVELGDFRLKKIVSAGKNLVVYHERGTLVLSGAGKVLAKLDKDTISENKDYPGVLDIEGGFIDHGRFGFYGGKSLSYIDRNTKQKSRLMDEKFYGFLTLGEDELFAVGPKESVLIYPEILEEYLNKEAGEKDFKATAADLKADHRAWSDQRIVSLAGAVSEGDILYDLSVRFKPGTDRRAAEAAVAKIGGKIAGGGKDAEYLVKLGAGADWKGARERLTQSGDAVFATLNPLRDIENNGEAVGGQLILTFRDGATQDEIGAVLKKRNLSAGPRIGQHAWLVYTEKDADIVKLSTALSGEAIVGRSELNYVSHTAGAVAPNDPMFNSQWALNQVGYDKVWNKPWPYKIEAVVAVIDSGVEATHVELAGRVLDGPDYIDLDNSADDENGHGTAIAGVIASGVNNATGTTGLCGNCGVLRVRVADKNGNASVANIAEAIRWVADDGRARVINISIVGYAGTQALWDAVKYAESKGIVVIAPAGNDSTDTLAFPAAFPEVIAVSSTNRDGQFASSSNYGSYVDVSAPGDNVLTIYPGGVYRLMNGSSFSAAMVSGMVGNFLTHMNDATVEQIKTELYKTSVDLGEPGRDAKFGWGRINAEVFLSEESLTTPLREYYQDVTPDSLTVYTELPVEMDAFATGGLFKKLFHWVSEALSKVLGFLAELVEQVVIAIRAIVQAVCDAFDYLYKQVLRPLLKFFCNGVCPIISFTKNVGATFNIADIVKASPSSFLSIAGTFCAVGCPFLTSVGVIQPSTRLVCEDEDPAFKENKHEVTMDQVIHNETLEGPFDITLKTGEAFQVESSVDLMQELHVRGVSNPDLDFDGIVITRAGYDDAALHAERKCWNVEYNPYTKLTKILDKANKVLNVINVAHSFVDSAAALPKDFKAALDGDFGAAKKVFDDLNNLTAYMPGEKGDKLRSQFSKGASLFGSLAKAQDYIKNYDAYKKKLEDKLNAIEQKISKIPDSLNELSPSTQLDLMDGLSDIGDDISNSFNELDHTKVSGDKTDIATNRAKIEEAKKGNLLIDIGKLATQIKSVYSKLRYVCSYSNDDICDDVREFAHSDFMKGVTLGAGLYELMNYDKCNGNFVGGDAEGAACGNVLKLPKGTKLSVGINNMLADDLLLEAWKKDTGEVVFTQSVDVPPPSTTAPLKPAEMNVDWNWRDKLGNLVKPGNYGIRATYTDITGLKKTIDVLGQNDTDYPIAPGELFGGAFDSELLGKAAATTTFNVDAGQEYLSFEFDFADRRGAYSVISVELLVYDLSEKLIWHETRQMPALGDENTQGYDNTFIWPLKNIDTGATVPDASYTFRLVTTMKSGKQYVSYFAKDVARTDPPPPATGTAPVPAVAQVRIPDTGIDRYMKYDFGPNGLVMGGTDSFGNHYNYERDANGYITGSVEPDGTRTDYYKGGKQPTKITDARGNTVDYTYNADGKAQQIKDGFGNVMNFAYPSPNTTKVTDQAGFTTTKILNDMGLPLNVTYPDGSAEANEYDGFGNLKKNVDPMGRQTNVTYNDNNQPLTVTDALGNVTTYEYDGEFNLKKVTDALGEAVSMTYDSRGNMLTQADPAGRVTTYTYDASNRPLSVSDPLGNVTSYTYTGYAQGPPASVRYPDGSTVSYTYYTEQPRKNLVWTMTDARGGVWRYEYDLARALKKATNPLGQTATFDYDAKGQMTAATDFAGRVVSYQYDPVTGNVLKVTGPLGLAVDYTYDASKRVKTMTAPDGGVTAYDYDAMGRVKKVAGPLGETVSSDYYADGALKTATDARGNISTVEYDGAGRVKKACDAAAKCVSYTYDAVGHIKTLTDRRGKVTTYNYDAAGQLTSVVDPLGHAVKYRYDARGLLNDTEDAEGNISRRAYDSMGRALTVTDPLGNVTSMTYNTPGDLRSVTSPKGNVTSYEYDALGRMKTTRNAQGVTSVYDYNDAGDMTGVTDENGHKTSFAYDALGRMTGMCNALNQCESYHYNTAGRMDTTTNRRSQTVSFTYDLAGQLKTKSYTGYSASFDYDVSGNPLSASDGNGTVGYAYEPAKDRVSSVSFSGAGLPSYTTSYGYDDEDNVTSSTGPNGATGYLYDDAGRLTTINSPAGAFSFDYYDRGLVKSMTYPNGVAANYGFDAAGQLTLLENKKGAAAVSSFAYHYDADGNRDVITDAAGAHAYGYDVLDQLTTADHPAAQAAFNPDESYLYDPVGNRVTTHLSNIHVVNALNQLLEDNKYIYEYDADGNLNKKTEKVVPANVTTYTFNPENQLMRVDMPGNKFASFKYDVLGRRIEVNNNGIITRFAYDGDDLASEYNASNILTYTYVYGPGVDNILARKQGATTLFYHKDALQSVVALTDAGGNVVQSYKYDSFGNVVSATGTVADNRITYTGREWDKSVGMYFYRARFYEPKSGAFTSEDPEWQSQLYAYVGNSPLNFFDPYGMKETHGLFDTEKNNKTCNEMVHNPEYFTNGNWFANRGMQALGLVCKGAQFISPNDSTADIGTVYGDTNSTLLQKGVVTGIFILDVGTGGKGKAGKKVLGAAAKELAEKGGKKLIQNCAKKTISQLILEKVVGKESKIMAYSEAKKVTKDYGGDISAHHIIETRHLEFWKEDILKAPAIVLTRGEHQALTTALQKALPTGDKYSRKQVWAAYQKVYKKHPKFLKAIKNYF